MTYREIQNQNGKIYNYMDKKGYDHHDENLKVNLHT